MFEYREKFEEIKEKCLKGEADDILSVLSLLNDEVDLPTTRAIDFYLGQVNNSAGIRVLEKFLFEGTQVQRNYCTLFFARRDEWNLVNKAYHLGLIDALQAYSK